jgi:hypothetical protein
MEETHKLYMHVSGFDLRLNTFDVQKAYEIRLTKLKIFVQVPLDFNWSRGGIFERFRDPRAPGWSVGLGKWLIRLGRVRALQIRGPIVHR